MGPVFWLRHRHRSREPSGPPQPTVYDFTGGVLPSGATLTRSSTGTYYNSAGLLEIAAINAARFEYDPSTLGFKGLLIEPQRTNIIAHSNAFSSWGSFGATVAANAAASPDGTNNAWSFTAPSGGRQGKYKSFTAAAYVTSVFAKSGNYDYISNLLSSSWGTREVGFNLSTQVRTHKSSDIASTDVQNVGNGWGRYVVVPSTPAATLMLFVGIASPAPVSGSYVYYYGAQVEMGTKPTSYIPTTTASVTRAADLLALIIPSGATTLRLSFDDDSTQDIDAVPYAGSTYTIDPETLNRRHIKQAVVL